tara:strand:- start:62 stop:814 length:753 start_codon:yes stop_codon:yes gene_type:complete
MLATAFLSSRPAVSCRPPPPRSPAVRLAEGGGWWANLNPWAELPVSAAVAETVDGICRPDGWSMRCTLGSQPARELGGTGTLAKGEASSTVGLDYSVRFELEEGFDPPQGTVSLLSSSRLLSSSTAAEEAAAAAAGARPAVAKGFWSVDATDDEDVPTAIKWRLACAGIESGGVTIVPEGQLYSNALVGERRPLPGEESAEGARLISLGDGRLTVKEDVGVNTIFQARGILAEFKLVGRFDASPRTPVAE